MANKDKLLKIDGTILDNYYKLVNTDQNVRLRAAMSTYKILSAMKKNNTAKFNEHLNYCVERLVAGLASSRASARRGYAMLLLEILKNHQVSVDRLQSISDQKFGNISKESEPDSLLGHFLLITVMLESKIYKKSKKDILEKMFKRLIQLKTVKSYFDFPVSKLITDNFETFYPQLLAHVEPGSLGTGIRITHSELLILTLCNKKEPMREFVGLENASIDSLSMCLTNDRLQRRPLHPIWIEYGSLLMQRRPDRFEHFYSSVLSPTFFKPNHNELATIGLELVAVLLERANDSNLINVILSDYIIRLLIRSRKHCQTFFKMVDESFKRKQNHDWQFYILDRLTSPPGSIVFDEDSKSRSLNNLMNNCQPKALAKYLDKLADILKTRGKKRLQTACVGQIAHILLLGHQDTVSILSKLAYGEENDLWSAFKKHLANHLALLKSNPNSKLLNPISKLYFFYGLQIIEHDLDCETQLQELSEISKDALKNDPNDGSWADVLTDQIIAILSSTECRPWIRKLCVSVFGSLLPHITETSIDLINEALATPLEEEDDEGDESDMDDEEDEEDEEDETPDSMDVELPSLNQLSAIEEMDEDDLEDNNDKTDDDDDEKKDEQGDRDDDEDDEEYLDDEQMMKLDGAIADMLKTKKRDPSFQLRVLDLVKKILSKKRNDQEFVGKILATMGQLEKRARKSRDLKPISDKIRNILR